MTRTEDFEAAARRYYDSFVEDIQQGMTRLKKARGGEEACEDCGDTDASVTYRTHSDMYLCDHCLEERVEDGREAAEKDSEETTEPEDEDTIYDEFQSYGIEKKVSIEITLGSGGPAMGLTLELDSDGDVESGSYWYQDWFTEKKRFPLESNEIDAILELYRIDPYEYVHGG